MALLRRKMQLKLLELLAGAVPGMSCEKEAFISIDGCRRSLPPTGVGLLKFVAWSQSSRQYLPQRQWKSCNLHKACVLVAYRRTD